MARYAAIGLILALAGAILWQARAAEPQAASPAARPRDAKPAELQGSVTDEGGRPIAGASVRVLLEERGEGTFARSRTVRTCDAVADEKGQFKVEAGAQAGLPPK